MYMKGQEIIPKKEIPEEMPSGLCVKSMFSAFGEEEAITEESLKRLIDAIRRGNKLGVYLADNADFWTDKYMQIEIDRGLAMLQLVENDGTADACFYASFDPDYLDSAKKSPMECSDGQSVILMRYTMRDLELAAKCAEYFARTGERYPGMSWLKG